MFARRPERYHNHNTYRSRVLLRAVRGASLSEYTTQPQAASAMPAQTSRGTGADVKQHALSTMATWEAKREEYSASSLVG